MRYKSLQTLHWGRMTCSSTFLKFLLAVLAQTPAAHIWCIAICSYFQLRKKVLRLDAPSYQSSDSPATLFMTTKWARVAVLRGIFHLTQGGRTTMMPMPVNRITSQCKIKLSQKYCPWINLQLWNFCHSFLQWMGIFFLIIMFCSAIHVYTDRFTDMGIIVTRPPWLRCEFLAELPLVLIFWS